MKIARLSCFALLSLALFGCDQTVKKTPNSIGLIWDNSLSCQTRDLKKELDLLEAYFQKIKNTKRKATTKKQKHMTHMNQQ